MEKEVLGIDIGGVISSGGNEIFTENFLNTAFMPGAVETIHELVAKRFQDCVHLVSKCGDNMQRKTREWLDHHHFYERTGVQPDHVWFCYQRYEKSGICEKLGITHFIDDRLEILGSLISVKNLYLFQPKSNEVRKYTRFINHVHQVNSWQEVSKELLPKY